MKTYNKDAFSICGTYPHQHPPAARAGMSGDVGAAFDGGGSKENCWGSETFARAPIWTRSRHLNVGFDVDDAQSDPSARNDLEYH